MHSFDLKLLFIVGFWIILTGGFLLEKKLYPAQHFLLKCFCYQQIGNSQAYQSLGVKQMQTVFIISLTEAFFSRQVKAYF